MPPALSPAPASVARPGAARIALAAAVITAAGVLAYANSFQVPFVFDDELSIPRNPTLASLWQAWHPPTEGGITVAGRPLLNFSFAINHAISGTDVWSYHALNLAIQIAAGLALFAIVRRTLLQPRVAGRFGQRAFPLALGAAALWTLHPLQTESVTYIVQRAESLMSLCYLVTLWCFIRGVDRTPQRTRWLAAVWTACAAGMATKEVMVTAPVIVALYDRIFVAGAWREVWRQRRAFYAALAGTWVLLVALVLSTAGRGGTFALTDPAAWWRYDLTQFVAVTHYFRLMLWPWPLVIDYGTFWIAHWDEVVLPALVVVALLAGIVFALRRTPPLGFLGCWFFVILAPSTLPPGTIQMIVEHRVHLPLAAVCVGAVVALDAILGRRSTAVVVALALAFGAISARRNADYATPIRLFEDTVARRPANGRAMALLADYYRRVGRLDDARRLLERSLTAEPGVAPVLTNLGNIWQELGNPARAVDCFTQALARAPTDAGILNNLGNALLLTGRPAEAIAQLRRAVELEPTSSTTRLNLAKALAQQGDLAGADEQLVIVARAQPDDAETHAMRATLLQQLNRGNDAIAELRTAVRLRPADSLLHDQLGTALGRAGQLREALAEFETALRLNPGDENARQNAAIAARRLGIR